MLTVQLVKTAFAMGWEAQLVKLYGGEGDGTVGEAEREGDGSLSFLRL